MSNSSSRRTLLMIKYNLFFSLLGFFIFLSSCGQTTTRHKVNPESVRLSNKIIPLLSFTNNPDSCRKTLLFLDSATAIDSDDFIAYYNKLMFLYGLKEYNKAINTTNILIRLRPNAHDLYMLKGNLLYKIGDTTSANLNFEKSLKICNSILDTMHETNRDYVMFVMDKAINLIMLEDSVKANKILKILYDRQHKNPAFGNDEKKYILSLMNKNRIQLIDFLNKPEPNTTGSNSNSNQQ